MNTNRSSYFFSTIGKKQLVGVTGLALSLFVLSHMLGNLLIFAGPEAYNMYGHKLVSNPFIYIAEAGLVGMFCSALGFGNSSHKREQQRSKSSLRRFRDGR